MKRMRDWAEWASPLWGRPQDADAQIFRRATFRIGVQVAALSAVMIITGAVVILAYLWHEANEPLDLEVGHTLLVALDPDDLVEAAAMVGTAVIILAGICALWFARRAVAPLEESMRRQRNFVGDASHELRTPLAVMSARVQQLEILVGRDHTLQPVVTNLREDTQFLTEIVNDLLTTVTGEESGAGFCDLRTALEWAGEEMSVLARECDVSLNVKGPDAIVAIPELPFRRSLLALLDNAIGHTPAGGEVHVRGSVSGRWALVRISDEGSGIRGIEPERVFERFAHGTPSRKEGTRTSHGIGLALVQDTIIRHDGRIEVEKTDEEGTTFLLRLPLAKGTTSD